MGLHLEKCEIWLVESSPTARQVVEQMQVMLPRQHNQPPTFLQIKGRLYRLVGSGTSSYIYRAVSELFYVVGDA